MSLENRQSFGLIKRYQQVEVTRLEEVDLSFNLDADPYLSFWSK